MRKNLAPPRPPTPVSLRNIAMHYLSRYAANSEKVRRVLDGRLRRTAMRNPAFAADQPKQQELRAAIATIIADLERLGLVQDDAYALTKTNSLRRAGGSKRMITMKLQQQGVTRDQIAQALEAVDEHTEDGERTAAIRFAKRKRLGKFRTPPGDSAQHRRDLAAMARAGFALGLARDVLQITIDDMELE